MRQLTNKAIREIIQALDEGYFTSASFELNYPEEGQIYLNAKFIDNKDFIFELKKGDYYGSSGKKFNVVYTPGVTVTTVQYETSQFIDICKSLQEWSNNIKEQLIVSNPIYTEFEQFKRKLNDEIESKFNDSNEKFTVDEIQELRNNLTELMERIEDLHEKNNITTSELERIKQTIEQLKKDADILPKKPWYRAMGNKVANLMISIISSKSGQKILEDGARKIFNLPPRIE